MIRITKFQLIIKSIIFFILSFISCEKNYSPAIPNLKPTTGTWHFLGFEDKNAYKVRQNSDYLYACAASNGLWRKNLSEVSSQWQFINLGDTAALTAYGVQDVIFDELNEDWLLVTCRSENPENHSIYRSFDNGNSWHYADSALQVSYNFNGVWYYYYRSFEYLIKTNQGILGIKSGIYFSDNFGETWQLRGGVGASTIGIYDIDISKNNENIIWVSGSTIYGKSFVSYTINDGNTWTTFNIDKSPFPFEPQSTYNIAIDPNNSNNILLGSQILIRSKDGGKSWKTIATLSGDRWFNNLTFHPESSYRLYATSGNKIIESCDGGVTWQEIENPFPDDTHVWHLEWSYDLQTIFFSTNNGIYEFKID